MEVNGAANVQLNCELGERQSEPCPQMRARLGGFFGGVKLYSELLT